MFYKVILFYFTIYFYKLPLQISSVMVVQNESRELFQSEVFLDNIVVALERILLFFNVIYDKMISYDIDVTIIQLC